MDPDHLKIAFIRRGFSRSGGAEAYLKRLAQGVCAAGHETLLVTTEEWPANEWPFGPLACVAGKSPMQFADEVEEMRPRLGCDVVMSLERVWRCDVYRAGDGVHRAWLDRRAKFGGALQKIAVALNRKHRAILQLEDSLFRDGGARRVIANSEMVKREMIDLYSYPADQIDVVYNGVPVESFRSSADERASSRVSLGLTHDNVGVLFVGSGWERKGLRFAIEAVESCRDPGMRLLVAGRGNQSKYRSSSAQFLDVVQDLPRLYEAADIFLLPTIYDPFSNACLEAIASGIPVITTSANGVSEIIENGTHGSVVNNPADVGALASALRLWSDPDRRAAARAPLQELAARFDISGNVAQTLQILLQVAAKAALTSGNIRKT
jgi:UDP-glucose:(heptosyl)LPS alpha-1,3-glucosyltransferase